MDADCLTADDLRERERVTAQVRALNLAFMGKSWPAETFNQYLRALMDRGDIEDFAELSRLTGVSESLFSNWKRGRTQPRMESLDRIADALSTSPRNLYIAAGLVTAEKLDQPNDVDLTVLPREILNLIALYNSMTTDSSRRLVREQIDFAVRGLQAKLAERKPQREQPSRPAKRRAS